MAIQYETEADIKVERKGSALLITLNRPERLNAVTIPQLHRLGAIIKKADEDPDVRVLIFTGEGRAFCSGADASGLKGSTEISVEQRLANRPYFTPRMCKVYKPSICAVNGMCAGAGLHFVADCDIIIASDTAQFTDTHVNIGQVTALEPIGLSRRVPLGTVLRMVILGKGERLSAQQALAANMVSEVVPADKLLERAFALAELAAKGSPRAVSESLKALYDSFEVPLEEAYDKGFERLMRHRDHSDAREGPVAFMEKREPKWSS